MSITPFRTRAKMEFSSTIPRTPEKFLSNLSIHRTPRRIRASFSPQSPKSPLSTKPQKSTESGENRDRSREDNIPTMAEILEASRRQNLEVRLQTLGPFFRITAKNMESEREVGRAEGVIRVWVQGKILHLDSIRLKRESLGMKKSIFGLGLFIGGVAVRYGFDCGCKTAELLAINDSDVYHSKLVRFYRRMGFKAVKEVDGSTVGDAADMVVWGGVGTRMDADIQALLLKWSPKFKSPL